MLKQLGGGRLEQNNAAHSNLETVQFRKLSKKSSEISEQIQNVRLPADQPLILCIASFLPSSKQCLKYIYR